MSDASASAPSAGRRFDVKPTPGGMRFLLLLFFWIWGLGFGFYAFVLLANANAMGSLGVGTSSAVTMNIAMWIGGLLLFGLGAIGVRPKYELQLTETK